MSALPGIPFLAKPIRRSSTQTDGHGLYDCEAAYISHRDFELMLRSDDATSFLESLKWSIINKKEVESIMDNALKNRPFIEPPRWRGGMGASGS